MSAEWIGFGRRACRLLFAVGIANLAAVNVKDGPFAAVLVCMALISIGAYGWTVGKEEE